MEQKKFTRLKLKTFGFTVLISLGIWGLCLLFEELVLGRLFDHALKKLFLRMAANWSGLSGTQAATVYRTYLSDNKPVVMLALLVVILLVVCYCSYSRFSGYMNRISEAARNLVNNPDAEIVLPRELGPILDDLQSIQRALSAQRDLARLNEQRKNDLVAYLAHDLKTPLTSILGYLDLLANQPDLSPEQRAKYTGIALDKAHRLEKLMGEFFDISRMELADTARERVELRLDLLLAQLTEEFYPLFSEKNLDCVLEIPEKLLVSGNPDQLARTFDNVLRNAVSYSDPNTAIHLRAVCQENWVEVTISNQGLEIPESQLSSIFQKFYRLDEARQSSTGGAGLGLAIAKEIVELHGGTIQATSTGNTTSFAIKLPGHSGGV